MSANIARLTLRGALQGLVADIDEYCGTGPHPPIPHLPWLRDVLGGVAVSRLASTLEESPIRVQLHKYKGRHSPEARCGRPDKRSDARSVAALLTLVGSGNRMRLQRVDCREDDLELDF